MTKAAAWCWWLAVVVWLCTICWGAWHVVTAHRLVDVQHAMLVIVAGWTAASILAGVAVWSDLRAEAKHRPVPDPPARPRRAAPRRAMPDQ